MIFEKKEVILKSGETAIFRSPMPEDSLQMLAYLKATSGETDFMLRYPEECTMTQAQEASFLQGILDSDRDLMILCEIDGKLAGNCSISFHPFQKTRHRADVAIGILKEHWNKGIGSIMFREMIAAARARGIRQLELEVVEGNDRAIALYEKMGFRTVSQRPNAIYLKDGRLLKEYLMVKTMD